MKRIIASALVAGLTFGVMTPPLLAQDKTQVVPLEKVDLVALSTGHRASKITGGTVINDAGDKVGTIDDVIIGSKGNGAYAILSVGGFLGVDSKLVAVDYDSLQVSPDKIVLPGATKDTLQQLPTFSYDQ